MPRVKEKKKEKTKKTFKTGKTNGGKGHCTLLCFRSDILSRSCQGEETRRVFNIPLLKSNTWISGVDKQYRTSETGKTKA